MLKKIMLIAIAGGLGTLARYGLSGLVQRLDGSGFAWGTTVVNLAGCLLFGLFWSVAEERFLVSSEIRIIVLTGFMGAFTTFSTYVFETSQLMRDAEWLMAGSNIVLQTVGGLCCFFVGLFLGRVI